MILPLAEFNMFEMCKRLPGILASVSSSPYLSFFLIFRGAGTEIKLSHTPLYIEVCPQDWPHLINVPQAAKRLLQDPADDGVLPSGVLHHILARLVRLPHGLLLDLSVHLLIVWMAQQPIAKDPVAEGLGSVGAEDV